MAGSHIQLNTTLVAATTSQVGRRTSQTNSLITSSDTKLSDAIFWVFLRRCSDFWDDCVEHAMSSSTWSDAFWNVHVFWDMATGPWPAAMDSLQFTQKQLCTALKVPKPRTSYAAWLHQATLPTDPVYITAIRTVVHIYRDCEMKCCLGHIG